MNPGRIQALFALRSVERGALLDDVLRTRGTEPPPPLSAADRALARRLVRGVLQRRRELDACIDALSRRPLSSLDELPRNALRMGFFELRHSRVPPHAAVAQAVGACRAAGAGRAAGFVNALLRRHASVPDLSPREASNLPEWLLERWDRRYGQAAAARWAERECRPAPLSLAALPGEEPGLLAALQARDLEYEPARAAGQEVRGVVHLRHPGGPVEDLPGYHRGTWWVQDPAAAAVADLVPTGEGARVLDACAAPGGKSFRLAGRGARVTAVDRPGARIAALREGARRLGLPLDILEYDWESPGNGALPGPLTTPFDAVLLDAPCTGLGTLRRHPDIRWHRTPSDLLRMQRLQLLLLRRVAARVAPGGVLVYAVCSPEPEEGELAVERFLEDEPRFDRDLVWTSAPPTHQEDAFWAVRLRRSSPKGGGP